MKKFFSLICALAIIFSANAVPSKLFDGNSEKKVRTELQAKFPHQLKKVPSKVNKKELNASFAQKQTLTAQKAAPAVKVVKAHKARKADLSFEFEVSDITTSSAVVTVIPSSEEGTYYFDLLDAETAALDDEEIKAYFIESIQETIEFYAYFGYDLTFADFLSEGEDSYEFEDLEASTEYVVVAFELDEEAVAEGPVARAPFLTAEFVPTGDTIRHDFAICASLSYSSYWADWTIIAQDEEAYVKLDILSENEESAAGEFESADFDLGYTYFAVPNEEGDLVRTYAIEASAKIVETEDSILIAATLLCEDGNVYEITAFFAAPTVQGEVTIEANNLEVDDSYLDYFGVVWFDASNEDYTVALTLYPEEDFIGTFEFGDLLSGSINDIDIFSGEITVAKSEEGYTLTGKVLCFDNIEYTLDLKYVKPEPTREEVLMIEGLELGLYEGMWQLAGLNADETQYVSIVGISDEVTGNYNLDNLYAAYCYIYTDLVLDEEGYVLEGNRFKLVDADLTVQFAEADSTIIIAGNFLGQNGQDVPLFTVLLKGRIPAEEVSDLTFEFRADEEGITVIPSNDEEPWDWYIADEETFEAYGADGIAEAVYDYYGNAYAITGEQFFAWDSEEIQYYCADGGKFYLVTWGSGERNVTTEAAVFEFEVEGSTQGNEYDAEEDFIVDFNGYEVDDRYIAQGYNVLFIYAETENNQYVNLELWLPEGASELVAGEYEVSAEEGAPMTVTTCELSSDGYLYGSFAATFDEEGYINVPLWFFAGGKVIVAEDGTITVDAVNTKGAAIKSILKVSVPVHEEEVIISYLDDEEDLISRQTVELALPEAPEIEGFKFVGWKALASENLISQEGILLQAVYEAIEEGVNPAEAPSSLAQKLIREGNVYVLRDTKTFTLKGQLVK